MQNKTVFIIDAGNSSIKVARFNSNQLIEVQRFPKDDLSKIKDFISTNKGQYALSSVLSKKETKNIIETNSEIILLETDTNVDMKINYGTTNTLGMDRLCNAVFAYNRMKTDYAVALDIGTCIKFDLVHKTEGYIGGSISPGIDLRYKALNDYTGKLPLLSNKTRPEHVGTSTNLSIQSGVMNGINAEINEMIEQYRERFSSLTFFVTGGDARNFDIPSKNDIFADENLTLIGLHEIYQQNA
ncbi:MAG: type III pantothenate kinase [Crocinitomicaceae bacterium]|nr:type III pantothenate kinase [Flavobacteriales bacterium]NQZ35978.1 type III pantothenate kinase [Crocinitomicaceae bacterium]